MRTIVTRPDGAVTTLTVSSQRKTIVAIQDAATQQSAAKANDPMSQIMPIMAMKMMRKT